MSDNITVTVTVDPPIAPTLTAGGVYQFPVTVPPAIAATYEEGSGAAIATSAASTAISAALSATTSANAASSLASSAATSAASAVTAKTAAETARDQAVAAAASGGAAIDDTAGDGVTNKVWSANKVFDELVAAKAQVKSDLVNGSAAALDTLKELADALGGDANFATSTATALGNRVRFDAAQTLTSPQKAQALSNIGAPSVADLAAKASGTGTANGTNTGDETTTTLGSTINGAAAKTTPVDADLFPIRDTTGGLLQKVTWANVKATLKTYFDTLYGALASSQTWTKAQIGGVTTLTVSTNAISIADLSTANNYKVTLQATTGQTLVNPSAGIAAGQSGQIAITQNATPSALAFGSYWTPFDGTTPSVSTTAGTTNLLTYYVVDATHIWFSLSKQGVA